MSNSLWPHELQHARLLCPSPSPGACSNSCLLSWWCHPTISSSVIPFSFCLQSFPASESFPMSQFFTLGSQSIGTSASASVLPKNIQDWFPSGWTGWISWQSKGLSRHYSSPTLHSLTYSSKASILWHSACFIAQLSHPFMIIWKTIVLTRYNTSWQIDGETVADFIFPGSKITADGDCSHEIKRCLLLGRKVMTNLDSILKSRGITLSTKVCLVKDMVFAVVTYGCESWTIKKAECQRVDAFELWCWRRLLRVPWTARRSN